MARLFTTGFELNSLTDGVEIGYGGGTGNVGCSIVSSPVHGVGSFSLKMKPAATIVNWAVTYGATGTKTIFLRFYYYVVSQPASNALLTLVYGATNGTVVCRLRGTGSGIKFTDSGDTQRGSNIALNTGQWYRVELKVFSSATVGTADLFVYDGDTNNVIGQVNQTALNLQGTDIQGIQWGSGSSLTHEIYIDDIAVNDGTGSFQNTYVGAGYIVAVRPNGAGASSSWTRGGTDSGNNWDQVNEVTPNDVTDYVSAGASLTTDSYTITPSGVGTGIINCVLVSFRITNDVADASASVACGIVKTGAIVSSDLIPSSTTWKTNAVTTGARQPPAITSYQDPDSLNWTGPVLDACQLQIQRKATGTHAIRCTAIWALVDYTDFGLPGVGGAAASGGGVTSAAVGSAA